MTIPRLSISGLMAVVLIAALNLAVIRILTRPLLLPMPVTELLIIGLMPMANILAFGLTILVTSRRETRPNRPALIGFEVFGLVGWLAFLVCSVLAPQAIHDATEPLKTAGMTPGLALASLVGVLFLIPQLGLAALGWWFGNRYVVEFRLALRRRPLGKPGARPDFAGEATSGWPGAARPIDLAGSA